MSSKNLLASRPSEKTPLLQEVSVATPSSPPPPKAHPSARKSVAQGGRYVALPKGTEPKKSPLIVPESGTIAKPEKPVEEKEKEVQKGRVTVYCTAGAFDKKNLRAYLEERQRRLGYPAPQFHQDVLYAEMVPSSTTPGEGPLREMFYFEYGVIVMWGMDVKKEQEMVRELAPFEIQRLEGDDVDIDEFDYVVDKEVEPRMVDDVITLTDRQDYRLRLAISYALSQSVKLSVFEEMIDRTIDRYKGVPVVLAKTGQVHMPRTAIAKAIGQLFMQTSAVNLVSNVLDTPDFFWEEPDYLERLYRAVRGYLEISRRCEVLNKRLEVVQAMMNILKDEQHQLHGEKLEWIVIWLIVVEIVIGIVGIVSTFYIHFTEEKHS